MSGEPHTALDLLEAELFRAARLELEPDQAHVEGLWQNVAAASTVGAAISGVGWAAPPSVTTSPITAPSSAALPSAAPSPTVSATAPVAPAPAPTTAGTLLQKSGQASFGLRALFGAAVGGALLGFAVGYGSAGGAHGALDSPGAANLATSSMATSKASSANHANQEAQAADATTVEEPQAPTARPGNSERPQAGRLARVHSSSALGAESANPSFYEELQYLKRAQSALRQGNGALALGLMASLDSIQPGGALLSERGVTQVLAHCQLGDVESAQRVARRLTAHGLASVYTERLENSCAGSMLSKR